MSSSGPMQTARRCGCGPTMCSIAAMNSWARRPWVTRTMPIMAWLPEREGNDSKDCDAAWTSTGRRPYVNISELCRRQQRATIFCRGGRFERIQPDECRAACQPAMVEAGRRFIILHGRGIRCDCLRGQFASQHDKRIGRRLQQQDNSTMPNREFPAIRQAASVRWPMQRSVLARRVRCCHRPPGKRRARSAAARDRICRRRSCRAAAHRRRRASRTLRRYPRAERSWRELSFSSRRFAKGSSTRKRAPSPSSRFSAQMRPPRPATIWRAMERPRPEFLPKPCSSAAPCRSG